MKLDQREQVITLFLQCAAIQKAPRDLNNSRDYNAVLSECPIYFPEFCKPKPPALVTISKEKGHALLNVV